MLVANIPSLNNQWVTCDHLHADCTGIIVVKIVFTPLGINPRATTADPLKDAAVRGFDRMKHLGENVIERSFLE